MTKPEIRSRAERGLAGYVRAVAATIGVPEEATVSEVTEIASAYLALARRSPRHPDSDLMLAWTGQHGWFVALDPGPAGTQRVVAHLGTADLVPEPAVVSAFVDAVIAGTWTEPARVGRQTPATERWLATRLGGYRRGPGVDFVVSRSPGRRGTGLPR